MNLIQKLKNIKLFKDYSSKELHVIEGNEVFLPKVEDVHYDEIVNISDNDFIDATSDISIQKYKSNLKNLVENAKKMVILIILNLLEMMIFSLMIIPGPFLVDILELKKVVQFLLMNYVKHL